LRRSSCASDFITGPGSAFLSENPAEYFVSYVEIIKYNVKRGILEDKVDELFTFDSTEALGIVSWLNCEGSRSFQSLIAILSVLRLIFRRASSYSSLCIAYIEILL
jgi:hypothetical protein